MTIFSKDFVKDSMAVKDYQIDWSDWLGADTISTSAWSVPAGITKNSDSNTTTTTTIWLSGGTDQADYEIYNTIVTTGGRTERAMLKIGIR